MLILKGHEKSVNVLAFSPDGSLLASLSSGGCLRMWDGVVGNERCIAGLRGGYSGFAFDPNGQWIAVSVAGAVSIRDMTNGKEIVNLRGAIHHSDGPVLELISCNPNGRWLVVSDAGGLHWWKTDSWQCAPAPAHRITWRDGALRLAFSPDGDTLATLTTTRICLWDTKLRTVSSVFPTFRDVGMATTALAYSHHGRWLAHSELNRLFVHETVGFKVTAELKLDIKHIQDATFSPDDRLLAVVSNEGAVRIWDTNIWQERDCYSWEIGPLRSVAFSPDGMRMATGSERGKIVLWDIGM